MVDVWIYTEICRQTPCAMKRSLARGSYEGWEEWEVLTPEFSLAYVNVHHPFLKFSCNIYFFIRNLMQAAWGGQPKEGILCPQMRPGLGWPRVRGVAGRSWFEKNEDYDSRLIASLLTIQDSRLCNITWFHFERLLCGAFSRKQKKPCAPAPTQNPTLLFAIPWHLKESHTLL